MVFHVFFDVKLTHTEKENVYELSVYVMAYIDTTVPRTKL